jgi:serine/threonine protein kinase
VICPNCSAGQISPLTHRCELCGFVPEGSVAVEASHAESVDELAQQELAEQFSLRAAIGHGAGSVVYLAREPDSSRDIVVKALRRPTEGRAQADERFARAVEAVAALEHPHLVPVFSHGSTEHLYWYSAEHVRGRSLRDYVDAHGPMEVKACLRLVAQVASALDHAHRRGIVHGALKPENVLIDAEGWVHVCDLLVMLAARPTPPPALPRPSAEAAPTAEEARTRARSPYQAPEELQTPFSDQFGLAALVYECLAGSPPPLAREEADTAPPLVVAGRSDIPAHLLHACRRALSPKPMDRFPSALDFVAALETHSLSSPDVKVPARTTATVLVQTDWEPPADHINWKVILGATAVVAIAAALAFPLRPAVLQLLHRIAGSNAPSPPATLIGDNIAPGGAAPTDTVSAPAALPPATSLRRPGAGGARAPTPTPGAERTVSRARERTRPAPERPGLLFVNATPWGQLYLDGALIGNTPRANLSVAPGSHTIRVVREGYEPFERTVRVTSGDTVRITDIVLVQRKP